MHFAADGIKLCCGKERSSPNEKLCLMSQLTLRGNISLRQKIETESACELFHMSLYSSASYAGVKYSRTSI